MQDDSIHIWNQPDFFEFKKKIKKDREKKRNYLKVKEKKKKINSFDVIAFEIDFLDFIYSDKGCGCTIFNFHYTSKSMCSTFNVMCNMYRFLNLKKIYM